MPSYAEADVARDGAFVAIHEMQAGQPDPVPAGRPAAAEDLVPSNYFDFGQVGRDATWSGASS